MKPKTRRRLLILALILLLAPLSVLLHPRARAALRLVSGFSQLPVDARIYFEAGGETQAELFARALPSAVERVEQAHGRPFKSPFRVYVCSSHRSFTEHLAFPRDSPVRGVAFARDVWLSPLAFDFHGHDTHAQSVAHELSHLHVLQHLGWYRSTRDLPTWFKEGLADWAADTGFEIISRSEALARLSQGRHFQPDSAGRLPLSKRPVDYGVSAPVRQSQSRLFVEHLAAARPAAFRGFVASLLSGAPFGRAFQDSFGVGLHEAWAGFLAELPDGTREPPRPRAGRPPGRGTTQVAKDKLRGSLQTGGGVLTVTLGQRQAAATRSSSTSRRCHRSDFAFATSPAADV